MAGTNQRRAAVTFPKPFYKLVIFGSLYNDTWNTSLSLVPTALGEISVPAVNDLMLTAMAGAVNTGWWQKSLAAGGFPGIGQAYLEGIKLNRITTGGLYADQDAQTHIYGIPIGANGGDHPVAPQLTTVATLRTAISRGPASKGRMYLPPVAAIDSLAADGRLSSAQALVVATSTKTLIEAVNGQMIGIARVGVASNVGSGRFEHVTRVTVGRVVDTMRSRRNKQLEEPEGVDIA
jgi:hypothetical protein